MSETTNQLIPRPSGALAVAQPSITDLMAGLIDRGITSENVTALTALVGLKERMDAKEAERAFAAAFVALQAEMPKVTPTRPVPNKDGSLRYKFAPYEEIMRQAQPFLEKHGFSVSFDTSFNEGRMKVTCTLLHRDGHAKSNEFAVRIGGGPPGSNEMQADGAAKTYAKRGALCDALNIVVEHDTDGADDARTVGATISGHEAMKLRRRAKECGADEAKLLAFARARSFEEIPEDMMPEIDRLLAKKEAALRPAEERDADGNFKF